jgi:hypothetical protein
MTTNRELNDSPVNALVPSSLRLAFDDWAARRGLTRSAAVKALITAAVESDGYQVVRPLDAPRAALGDSADPTCPDGQRHVYVGHTEHDDARGDVVVWTCRLCGADRPAADEAELEDLRNAKRIARSY